MVNRLEGKTAVISGVGPGIGSAIADAFAREGADLVLVSRGESPVLDQAASGAERLGRRVVKVRGDVAIRETWSRVAEAGNSLGGADIVVNNAAIHARKKNILEVTEEEWDATMAVNLKSVYFSCHALLPGMISRSRGVFVNISSVNGLAANPKMIDYAASKSALHGLTRNLALDHGLQGIRANVIAPGAILTENDAASLDDEEKRSLRDNYLVGRWGMPEDVANAAVFLASDEARFVTGVILPVDGGLTVQTPEGTMRKSFRARWRDDVVRIQDV
ncbi:SDR family oxidoreductase [Rhodoglobus aureus]|uniref:SDR family oxidoreductase n=1 Tax=Rhodoglobus aureus TaxID=191497 RepID=A0ABN1VQU0_9MICO